MIFQRLSSHRMLPSSRARKRLPHFHPPSQAMDGSERIWVWRFRHYTIVARALGEETVGTQGTPGRVLGKLIAQRQTPKLWERRSRLIELFDAERAAEQTDRSLARFGSWDGPGTSDTTLPRVGCDHQQSDRCGVRDRGWFRD